MKILLLSDATMCENAGGISQTLYNLFLFTNGKNLMCISSKKLYKSSPPTEPFSNCYITYSFEIIKIPNNRFTKYFTSFADWFNFSFNSHFRAFRSLKGQIKSFNPDIVVSCPNGPVGLFMHHKLTKGLNAKVFPYFMDDWMYHVSFKWLGGDINQMVKKILTNNRSWLMISKNLSEILQERYSLKPDRVLEIHNPVNLTNAPHAVSVQKKKEYTIAYAGSLWSMHYDALYILAKSVKKLNNRRKINFIVYTSEDFWKWRKSDFEPLGVIYGGNIPYNNIHQKLTEADALLVVSSFLKELYTISKGSLQTKITDYLKAKRLIISCGPSYSANNIFLKENNCGICIESNNEDEIIEQLDFIFNNIIENEKYVVNGWEKLQNYTTEVVHYYLQNFISKDG